MKPRYIEYIFANEFPKISSDIFYNYLGEEIFPAVITQLIGEYWSCLPYFNFKKLMPSLVCPASSEIYNEPRFERDDKDFDSLVYQKKVFERYDRNSHQQDQFVVPFMQYLRKYGCRLTIPLEQKFLSNEIRLSLLQHEEADEESKPYDELCSLLAVEHKSAINLPSEIKFQIERIKRDKKTELNLAETIYNYRFPLKYKILSNLSGTIVSARNTFIPAACPTFYNAMLFSLYYNIPWQYSLMMVPNDFLQYRFAWDYIYRRKLAMVKDGKFIKSMIAAASFGAYYYFLHPYFLENFAVPLPAVNYPIVISFAGITALSNTIEVMGSVDILLRERRDELRDCLPPFSWGAGIAMSISIVDKILNLIDIMNRAGRIDDYHHYLHQTFGVLRLLFSLSRTFVASRQSAYEFKQLIRDPLSGIVRQSHDRDGFKESLALSLFRKVSRVSASVMIGVYSYYSSEGDIARALLAALATLNESSLQNVFAWTPTLFRYPEEPYRIDAREVKQEEKSEYEVMPLARDIP